MFANVIRLRPLACLLVAYLCLAGLGCDGAAGATRPGQERQVPPYFEDGWRGAESLVVARVTHVERLPPASNGSRSARITLDLLALLSGTLNPARHRDYGVVWAENDHGPPPVVGATMMLVIDHQQTRAEAGLLPLVLPHGEVYMPTMTSVIEVDGLGDPRVEETLKRVRRGRLDGVLTDDHLPPPRAIGGGPTTGWAGWQPTSKPDGDANAGATSLPDTRDGKGMVKGSDPVRLPMA